MARQHNISVGNAKKRAQTAEYRFRIGDEFLIAQAEDTLWSTFPVLQTEPLQLGPFVGNYIRVFVTYHGFGKRQHHIAAVAIEVDIFGLPKVGVQLLSISDVCHALTEPLALAVGLSVDVHNRTEDCHQGPCAAAARYVATVEGGDMLPWHRVVLDELADVVHEQVKGSLVLQVAIQRHQRHHALQDVRWVWSGNFWSLPQHNSQQV